MKETIALTQKEQGRARVLSLVLEGRCSLVQGAHLMGVSLRQARRLKRAYREDGPAALAHGNRGRRPCNALPSEVADQVVALVQARYADYNHSHLHELLTEEHGLTCSRPTLGRLLRAATIRSPRRRKPRQHRQRRQRSAQPGMLIQLDASDHEWLEGRGPGALYLRAFLIVGVLGGLTTYSALMLECLLYARSARPGLMVAYLATTLLAGLALVWAGARLAEALRAA